MGRFSTPSTRRPISDIKWNGSAEPSSRTVRRAFESVRAAGEVLLRGLLPAVPTPPDDRAEPRGRAARPNSRRRAPRARPCRRPLHAPREGLCASSCAPVSRLTAWSASASRTGAGRRQKPHSAAAATATVGAAALKCETPSAAGRGRGRRGSGQKTRDGERRAPHARRRSPPGPRARRPRIPPRHSTRARRRLGRGTGAAGAAKSEGNGGPAPRAGPRSPAGLAATIAEGAAAIEIAGAARAGARA